MRNDDEGGAEFPRTFRVLIFGTVVGLAIVVAMTMYIGTAPFFSISRTNFFGKNDQTVGYATDNHLSSPDEEEEIPEQAPDDEEDDILNSMQTAEEEEGESASEEEGEVASEEEGEAASDEEGESANYEEMESANSSPIETENAESGDPEVDRSSPEEEALVHIYGPDKHLVGPINACHENNTKDVLKGTFEHEMLAADCGLGYNYLNSTSRKQPFKVVLYGPSFVDAILGLSGCLVGTGKCPFSPRCQIVQTTRATEAMSADVVVVFQNDSPWIDSLPRRRASTSRKSQYRVLYWREAFYSAPSVGTQKKFDFEMGVHWQSMLLNPQFFRTPAALLGGITYPHKQVIPFLPLRDRKNFAMSVISNCRTASQRNVYIQRLSHYLGVNRVHQFGRCGNMQLPPPPIKNAAKIIASYKFYLSFENTIEDGYVTEKLLHVLAMPVIPVYFGSPSTPNITITPSYIKVSDFSHPKHLADYLVYLSESEHEYYKYHEWRTNPKLFHPYFLKSMAMKSPGPNEMLPFRNRGSSFYPRSAACCRLCDENYVRWAKENREHFVQGRMTKTQIENRFFQGDFYGNPKVTTP